MSLYILDTDHISLHQRGNEILRNRLLTISSHQMGITIISVEESLRGRLAQVRKAVKPDERLTSYHWLLKTFEYLCNFSIFKYDSNAEAHFQNLRKQKIRIGTQDLKIAAIVLGQNATLITRNCQDFERIPSLKIEDWSIYQ